MMLHLREPELELQLTQTSDAFLGCDYQGHKRVLHPSTCG